MKLRLVKLSKMTVSGSRKKKKEKILANASHSFAVAV